MCYCDESEFKILSDIKSGSVPTGALSRDCCWKRICQVRGRHFNEVSDRTWRNICTDRGTYKFGH